MLSDVGKLIAAEKKHLQNRRNV